jgi:hypothetical protein
MGRPLFFVLSVALIFFSSSILTYSQSKIDTAARNNVHVQVKHVTHSASNLKAKTVSKKTISNKVNKKLEKGKQEKPAVKTIKVNEQKTTKNTKKKTSNVEKNMVIKHHKRMEKKTTKKDSDTPHKK